MVRMGYCGKSKKYMLFQPRTTVSFQEHSPRRRSFGVAIAFAFVIIVIFILCGRLPRRALFEGYRHLPIDQLSPSRGIPETFHSCSHRTCAWHDGSVDSCLRIRLM